MYIALLFAILLAIAVLAFFEDDKVLRRGWLLFLLATILTLVAAFRPAGIDNDYNSYLGYLENPSSTAALMTEPTFKIIGSIVSFCGLPVLLFLIYSSLSIPLKIYAIKRLSPYWYLSILLWFSHLFIMQEMTQIRVAVSSSIFLFAIPFLGDGNKKKYLLCLVVATLFHYSAIALIPLAFLGNKELSRLFRFILIVVPIGMYAFPVPYIR